MALISTLSKFINKDQLPSVPILYPSSLRSNLKRRKQSVGKTSFFICPNDCEKGQKQTYGDSE